VAAPAKLNLALLVGPRRSDGYHEVFSLMVPVTLADLVVAEAPPGHELIVNCAVCPGEENLAARAVRELEARLGAALPARLTIHKRTPHAAGLGGGSSDAAAAMLAVERLYGLDLPRRLLYEAASAVGSDVPFFLWPGPQLAMGRGSVLKAVMLPEPLHFVIAVPDVELPTRDVYAWRDADVAVGLREFAGRTGVLVNGIETARVPADLAKLVANDLESHVVARQPQIDAVKQELLRAGALAAAMTGSGAGVFGLFANQEQAEAASRAVIARAGLAPTRVFTATDLQPRRPSRRAQGGERQS
jgi:4-diphosphocytidyl-2-C-methyl-D-erythritol kinase